MVNDTNGDGWGGLKAGDLVSLANMPMPFGRYQGRALVDLPERYVVWMVNNAMPNGELGRLLGLLYEIKLNGLEYLLAPLRSPVNAL